MENRLEQSKKDRIPATMDFLGSYVVKHFATEKRLQQQAHYPKMAAQKIMHTEFIDAYKKLRKEYDESGGNPILAMKISRVALNWLKEHIRVQDKDFAGFYTEVGMKP